MTGGAIKAFRAEDLIDTLWNVKKMNDFKKGELLGDLIDTLWNVKCGLIY